ncbi:MAG: Scr1 family TA system antitoxin-like transcriptional regulator [Isosphaeraceae bacterium]
MNPTVRQRELGRRLREQRLEHGLIIEDVAEKLLCSARKIGRLETGSGRPSLRDVRDLCDLYNVGKATTDELMELARGAREQGWWTQYEDLKLDPYLGLEEVATAITSFTTFYLPALLQTEDYTREIRSGNGTAAFNYLFEGKLMSTDESALGGLNWRVSRTCESGACVAVARNGESILSQQLASQTCLS